MQKGAFIARRVLSLRELNATTRLISFEGCMIAQPGQFVMAWLPELGERPFSIASMDPCGLLVVDVGAFSHSLHLLKVGDRLWFKGPLGQGFKIEGERIILVAGGYGAAPLYPLAQTAKSQGSEVFVCLGARSAENILLKDAFEGLGCHVMAATEDGSLGISGLVTEAVAHVLKEENIDVLYGCGPVGLLVNLATMCRERKLDYQLSWEATMRCGMGLCGSCEVPVSLDPSLPVGWLACYDGPVFIKRWKPPVG
jgi:dihydroorotate dehydrogenase electron transfer subunit